MKIILAQTDDIKSIMEVFEQCKQSMRAQSIDQWTDAYPNESNVLQDIENQEVYIVEKKGKCLATITLNEQQDKQYFGKDWLYQSNNIAVIHRLAVHPVGQGKGLGKKLCFFAEEWAKNKNYEVIRLDAYVDNPISNHIYEQLGYRQLSQYCTFQEGKLFYCYEKKLD